MARTTRREVTGLHDIIAPAAIEFQTQTIQFGDQVARVICITDYPQDSTVIGGYLFHPSAANRPPKPDRSNKPEYWRIN